ncbi:GPP34 family phosphoprotein [Geomicrobium sp. JCM 19055]|uniref:GPP34 family phosphoprotein n=1 Tax=Geomicrobium sp. JCM 19055 TaxID=1460649 RepID=UPI00045ED4E3|nr:GPP34 family phosphoprotein [Geomicrobium sp. JCM 19055]GAK01311.1 Golgi phosphoprotein 3 [Geomicrobium sp. JCM 19055]
MLTLADHLFYIAVNEKHEKIHKQTSNTFTTSLVACILAELLLLGKLVEQNGKIVVIHHEVHHPLLQKSLNLLTVTNPKPASYWIRVLPIKIPNLKRLIAFQLEENEILHLRDKGLRTFFSTDSYLLNAPKDLTPYLEQSRRLVEKTNHQVALSEKDERMVILLSLLYASHLLSILYPTQQEAKRVEHYLHSSTRNLPVSKNVQLTIETIETSVITAASSTINASASEHS